MWKTKLLLGMLVILLAGCMDRQDIQRDSTATMIGTTTVTALTAKKTTSTPTLTITQTQQPSTPTPTISPTAEILPPRMECLEMVSEFPQTASRTGSVVILAPSMGDIPSIKILNMETQGQMFIEHQKYSIPLSIPVPSPDLHWLAFEDGPKLMLMDASGKTYDVVDWDKKWRSVVGWINENLVLVSIYSKYSDSPPPMLPPLGAVDIHTKEYREINRDYPGIDYADEYDAWFIRDNIITFYNPRFPIVAYPGMKTFVLFDLSTNEIIAEIKDENLRTISPPQWTLDGEYLLLAKEVYPPPGQTAHQEFFLIGRDGTVSQVTHFNDFHEYSEIGGFSLSPDGQKVAFWFMDRSIGWEENLYVLDLQTLDIVDTCITSTGVNKGTGPASPPIWSPDNIALINRVEKRKVEGESNVFFGVVVYLDITNGFAIEIAGDVTPLGWLVNQPAE